MDFEDGLIKKGISPKDNNVRCIYYTDKENKIIESGIETISNILFSDNIKEKQSLLFCLDKYLDPWYGYHLSYEKEIFLLLEQFVIYEKDQDTASDALSLLEDYSSGPYPVFEKYVNQLNARLKCQVKNLIQREAVWLIEEIMNDECKRIYEENYYASRDMNEKWTFPQKAIIVSDKSITSGTNSFPKMDCDELFSMENGIVKPIGIPVQGIPYEREPFSGDYFCKAEFYYGIDVEKMIVTLIYFFAKRRACCAEYSVTLQKETYILEKPVCIWKG